MSSWLGGGLALYLMIWGGDVRWANSSTCYYEIIGGAHALDGFDYLFFVIGYNFNALQCLVVCQRWCPEEAIGAYHPQLEAELGHVRRIRLHPLAHPRKL